MEGYIKRSIRKVRGIVIPVCLMTLVMETTNKIVIFSLKKSYAVH